jgi:dimethylargininase
MTYPWGRRLVASALSAFLVALLAHAANLVAFTISYLSSQTPPPALTLLVQISGLFSVTSVITVALLFLAFLFFSQRTWTVIVASAVAAFIAGGIGSLILVGGQYGSLPEGIFGFVLFYIVFAATLASTAGRYWYGLFVRYNGVGLANRKVALVRIPASNLKDGLVSHIERTEINSAKADEQWDEYVAALVRSGWSTVEVKPADKHADSVFVEDTAVVLDSVAVITLPGAESRRAEIEGAELALREQGLRLEHIEAPGTLDGGDVLIVGKTVYVGRSDRTNAEGVRQLRGIASELGFTVIAVPVAKTLHLKSAVSALPDGTVIGHPDFVPDTSVFERFLAVPEPEGASVVELSPDTVLMSAAAPKTAELIGDLGYTVVTVDISEFEKLEGCVTCLSIRIG